MRHSDNRVLNYTSVHLLYIRYVLLLRNVCAVYLDIGTQNTHVLPSRWEKDVPTPAETTLFSFYTLFATPSSPRPYSLAKRKVYTGVSFIVMAYLHSSCLICPCAAVVTVSHRQCGHRSEWVYDWQVAPWEVICLAHRWESYLMG